MKRPPNNFLPNQKNWRVDGEFLIWRDSSLSNHSTMSKNNSNAMLFKGNFPSCTNLKNFNSLSFFPTSESLSRTSWKTSTTEASSFGSTSILPILSSRLIKETFCRSAVKFPSSLVKRLRRIGVETRLKGYKYFEIERYFFNKLGVLVDVDFKFGVLLLVFVRFLGGDTGNLYRNGFL